MGVIVDDRDNLVACDWKVDLESVTICSSFPYIKSRVVGTPVMLINEAVAAFWKMRCFESGEVNLRLALGE